MTYVEIENEDAFAHVDWTVRVEDLADYTADPSSFVI